MTNEEFEKLFPSLNTLIDDLVGVKEEPRCPLQLSEWIQVFAVFSLTAYMWETTKV